MSDPIAAITEADATGEIADIYGDIRRIYRVSVVNLVWRHLATFPGALPWAWTTIRPFYLDGTIRREAAGMLAALPLPELPKMPRDVWEAAGLNEPDRTQIRTVLAAYDRSNSMALVAFTTLQVRLAPDLFPPTASPDAVPVIPSEPDAELHLPPLLSLKDMPDATARLVLTLNRFGAGAVADPVLASMYRTLAAWPAFLTLTWALLAPVNASGALDRTITETRAIARMRARRIAAIIPPSSPLLPAALRPDILKALDRFAGDAIARMVAICAMLHRSVGAEAEV